MDVARLSVLVDVNAGRAVSMLRGVDAQFKRTVASGRAMDSALAASGRNVGATAGLMRSAASGGLLAIGAGLYTSAKHAIEFDAAMRNVNSIARLSEARLKAVSQSVLLMAGPTAQAPVTLAKGMYDLVSSGFTAGQSLRIVEASARAASAGLTTTEVSTKAVAAVLNAYRMRASAAGHVSDVLFQTVNKGVLTFEDLAQNIGDGITVAANLGISIESVGAAIATLTKQGEQPSEAVTKIKNAMIAFLHPSEAMKASLDKLGYQNGEALIKAKGFEGALLALAGTTDGTKTAMQKLFPEIRGLQAALGLTGKNARTAKADLKSLNDSAGQTDRALAQQQQSTAYQWRQLKAEVSAVATTVGGKMNPAIFHTTRGLGMMAHALNDALTTTDAERKADRMATAARKIRDEYRALNTSFVATGKPAVAPQQQSAVMNLIAAMRNIPAQKRMRILMSGDADTLARLGMLVARVKSVPDKKKMHTILSGDGTVAQKLAMIQRLVGAVPSNKKVRVTAEVGNAIAGLRSVQSAVAGIPRHVSSVVDMTVRKHKGRATGGMVTENMTLVGERGPELVALPYGSYVYTASQSQRMLAGTKADHMAGGGRKKKGAKMRERADKRAQRILSGVDFLESTGRLTDRQEEARLRKVLGIKHLPTETRRDAARRIYELRTGRRSEIADLGVQAAQVGASPVASAQLQKDMAQRHLDEARRAKDSRAIAQAELELRQATGELASAQRQSAIDNLDAGVALAKLTPAIEDDVAAAKSAEAYWSGVLARLQSDNTPDDQQGAAIAEAANAIVAARDSIAQLAQDLSGPLASLAAEMQKNREFASRSHDAIQSQAYGVLHGILSAVDNSIGGRLAEGARTRSQGGFSFA